MTDDDSDKTKISALPPISPLKQIELDGDGGRTIISTSALGKPVAAADEPTIPPVSDPVDVPPEEVPEDAPIEDPVDVPDETPADIPVEVPDETPADDPAPIENPIEAPVEIPVEEPEEEPAAPPIEVPDRTIIEDPFAPPPTSEPPAAMAVLPDAEPVAPIVTTPPDDVPVDPIAQPIDVAPVSEPPAASIPPAREPSSVPAAAPMPTPPPVAVSDGGAVPIGTVINNNYAITQLISAGGMGEVFRGENTFTGDAVAIKIVLQSLAHDEKIAALFKREAKVLCGLSDKSIVRYYNFVRDADLDRFCLIMEFIDGIALSDHVKDVAPLTREEGYRLLHRLADGLARAHAMDVVHRDLSPDNVMLRDGDIDEAVLIDFGIAKSSEMAESTLHGQLAGKFKYISPEQLGHFGGEIGPRTDIYGLGLLMAAALRGEPLDMGSSVVEAVDARRGIPDVSDIDPALRPLIAHMLEPNPADRPATMSDIAWLLDHPEQIPEKYGRSEGMIPPGQTSLAPQGFVSSAGLQSPPGTGIRQPSIVPSAGVNDATSSPFGASASPHGHTLSQPGQTMNQARPAQKKSGGGAAGAVRWLILLGMLGAGGYYLSQNTDLIFPAETAGEGEPLPDVAANTPDGPMTRGSFLAGYHEGECGFAERISAGPQAGTIATYSDDPAVFDGLIGDYEDLFDAAPAVQSFTLDPVQCPAADLAKILAKNPGSAPILTLDSTLMENGGSIVGRLSDRRGRPVWLALVTTQGGVYNLTDRLAEQADGSATFSFQLNAPEGSDAQPQVLVALAADSPLIAAATTVDGTNAASVMPLLEAEILGRDGEAGMTLAYFDLKP